MEAKKIKINGLVEEDFTNYKKPAMFIGFPWCSMKCGEKLCQNAHLTRFSAVDVPIHFLVNRYMDNDISKAIVCGGLEPFDTWEDLWNLVSEFRKKTYDDIVIYSGYEKEEITDKIEKLRKFPNIVVKFGKFLPNDEPHYDEVIGVKLASKNQYAEKIS